MACLHPFTFTACARPLKKASSSTFSRTIRPTNSTSVCSNLSKMTPNLTSGKPQEPLARFVSFHPHNIAQKTEVMIEHFRTFTKHKIGGKAKAMVVTSSREAAVPYKL